MLYMFALGGDHLRCPDRQIHNLRPNDGGFSAYDTYLLIVLHHLGYSKAESLILLSNLLQVGIGGEAVNISSGGIEWPFLVLRDLRMVGSGAGSMPASWLNLSSTDLIDCKLIVPLDLSDRHSKMNEIRPDFIKTPGVL